MGAIKEQLFPHAAFASNEARFFMERFNGVASSGTVLSGALAALHRAQQSLDESLALAHDVFTDDTRADCTAIDIRTFGDGELSLGRSVVNKAKASAQVTVEQEKEYEAKRAQQLDTLPARTDLAAFLAEVHSR